MKKKVLVIGDPHLKVSNIAEGEIFLSQLLHIIGLGKFDTVVILGDLFDSFAVIRSEVLTLWTTFTLKASRYAKLIYMVGNHDYAGQNGGTHALEPFKTFSNVTIVDQVEKIDGVYFMPFMRDNAAFESVCRALPAGSVLFCHQSFNGAQFDNGFYDPHGADPACVAHLKAVICGHVHKMQNVGEVIWFPGTPRQMSFGEADQAKYVHSISLDKSGYTVLDSISLSTPLYHNVTADTIDELLGIVASIIPSSNSSYKLIAHGSPLEIQEFWKHEAVKTLQAGAKRVVDALTPVRPTVVLPGSQGKSQREKLYGFIESRQWRTPTERLVRAAEKLLTK